jgi:hypothetical protein
MKMFNLTILAASVAAFAFASANVQAQEFEGPTDVQARPQPVVPFVNPSKLNPAADAYPNPPTTLTDRKTWKVTKTQRGTTLPIAESDIINFCSGADGCIVRLGMHNWDDTGRVASRQFLFFYNKDTRVWRADNDSAGENNNNITEHVAQVFACYFTDGAFSNWQDQGDKTPEFGLLSWNQYNADCFLTIVR